MLFLAQSNKKYKKNNKYDKNLGAATRRIQVGSTKREQKNLESLGKQEDNGQKEDDTSGKFKATR